MFITYILIFIAFLTIIVKSKRSIHMLQQNLYNENQRYLKWIFKNKKEWFHFDSLAVILGIVLYITNVIPELIMILMILLYLVTIYYKRTFQKNDQNKKPLVVTARVKRLIVTSSIIQLVPFVLIIILEDYTNTLNILSLIYLPLVVQFNFIVSYVAKIINTPVEKLVYLYYYSKAMSKKKKMSNLKIVGITGSYGKTSSKNILSEILNIKFITRPTPRNLNTEYGMMITINNHLDKFDEVLIAEMGAYKKGEIKRLAKMMKPQYGILTTIGTAHLESFGSEKNIEDGKFELIEQLPANGVAILNGDDPKQVNHKVKSACKKVFIGINNEDVDVRASNIKCSHKGTTFEVNFKEDDKTYKFETKLLGNHNVSNILAAIALGNEMGIDKKDLTKAVALVKPVEHRLEIKKLGNFYQIDDAYNSNPVGAKGAVDVLSMMPGTKVIVTPGMIELGPKEEHYNQEFGKQIAETKPDYVVLIGEKRTKPIYNGLRIGNYNMDNVIIYNDVKEAYKFIQAIKTKDDIYALFENDLPDTYNE